MAPLLRPALPPLLPWDTSVGGMRLNPGGALGQTQPVLGVLLKQPSADTGRGGCSYFPDAIHIYSLYIFKTHTHVCVCAYVHACVCGYISPVFFNLGNPVSNIYLYITIHIAQGIPQLEKKWGSKRSFQRKNHCPVGKGFSRSCSPLKD